METSPSTTSATSTNLCLEDIPTPLLVKELKRRYNQFKKSDERRVIFLGAPGCGKGTQSAFVKERFRLGHLSTGDMLREAVSQGTPLGIMAKEIMARGELVNDDLVLGLIDSKLGTAGCEKGFILDGFPRNVAQAEGLDRLLGKHDTSIDAVVCFDLSEALLVERVCGRRVHLPSGRAYHILYNPPKVADRDDVTGEALTHRQDDNEETLRKRLAVFLKETVPLVDYYSKRKILHRIDASRPVDEIKEEVLAILGGFP